MESGSGQPTDIARPLCGDRMGVARLTKMAVAGINLRPLWQTLIAKVIDGSIKAGEGLDLSLIAQLLGDKPAGLAIQHEILVFHQLFRSPCAEPKPRLRVLALAAATDIGSNMPIEFLLDESDIELMTLYVIPEVELPASLPDHDIAIVIASDSEECRDALRKIDRAASRWPRPLLNPPQLVCNLDRDKLHRVLDGIAGVEIPATTAVARQQLVAAFAIVGCMSRHRGRSCVSRHRPAAWIACRRQVLPSSMMMTRSSAISTRGRSRNSSSRVLSIMRTDDGLFRKYRVVFVDGRPYACHMAIADRWDIWYLNAGMSGQRKQASRRRNLHADLRHLLSRAAIATALAGMADRIGLDYFTIDCAENKRGRTVDFRGRQYRDRAQHGFARSVSLQAAADAQDLRCVRGDALSPRPAGPGARGVSRKLCETSPRIGIERDARSAKIGTISARTVIACSMT